MKRYLVWALLAIGLHGWFLLVWEPNLQPAELTLQVGRKAVSLLLVDSSPSSAQSGLKKTTEANKKAEPPVKPEPEAARSAVANSVEVKADSTQGPHPVTMSTEPPTGPVSTAPLTSVKQQLTEDKKTVPINRGGTTTSNEKASTPPPSTAKPVRGAEGKHRVQQEQTTSVKRAPTKPKSVQNKEVKRAIEESKPTKESNPKPVKKDSPVKKNAEVESQDKSSATSSPMSASEPEGALAKARLQSSSRPKYPRRAVVRNQQGKVTVRLLVDKEGKVQNTELITSSGYKLLDKSVLRFVEREQFFPASQNGKGIASTQVFSFRFVLE